MFGAYGNIILIILFVPFDNAAIRLNKYISHYETLSYDKHDLAHKHNRAKRSVTNADAQVYLKFSAHNRIFHLRLKRDLSTFSENLVILDSSNKPLDSSGADISHIYTGQLKGERGSFVFGSLLDGVFEGKIISPETGAYYVEKSTRYFPDHIATNGNDSFHSIVYKESDIENPHDDKYAGCGITEDVERWMESVQTSAVDDDAPTVADEVEKVIGAQLDSADSIIADKKNKNLQYESTIGALYENPSKKYSKEMNIPGYRPKRAVKQSKRDKNMCSLYIQTDPFLWRHINEQVNRDPEKTKEEILSLIAHHVTAVNYIYRDTKFDGRMKHRNIKFEVQRIKIDDDLACRNHSVKPNPFCMENIDVSNFLNLHSLGNHEDFCLAYVFTYRDFTGGTLGLAWVASATGASGGICEKYKTYTETIAGLYQSTKRSLNTGIITFVNYNTRVPPKVSQLTLAHEIGHNFGSPHDYPLECRPGGLSGNYIMFASATSGDRPNNSKFSSCSIGNISNVLDSIEDNKKRNCFNTTEGAFCGNKIVEEGEECDCGYDMDECKDHCCYPRQNAKGCTRRPGAECSPSQGPCCYSNTCKYVPRQSDFICKAESECSFSSTCNGTSPECPPPKPKPNKTRCNEGTQLCISGECRGSICLEWGLNVCFLSANNVVHADKRKLCELACMNGTDPSTCRSTSEFASSVGLPPGGISLRPGSPCDNFQGYCDVFLKCRPVDAEGPLARLKNIVFNRKTLQTVQQWVVENWWACVLMGAAFIMVMAAFIKCCAVHTPSSNPKKPPARRFSETLRRPVSTLRRMKGPSNRHHHSHPQSGHHSRGSAVVMVPQSHQPPPYSHSSSSSSSSSHHQSKRSSHYYPKPSAPPATRADIYKAPHRDRSSFNSRHHK